MSKTKTYVHELRERILTRWSKIGTSPNHGMTQRAIDTTKLTLAIDEFLKSVSSLEQPMKNQYETARTIFSEYRQELQKIGLDTGSHFETWINKKLGIKTENEII